MSARQLVTQARQRVRNLTPSAVAAELESDADVVLIDVREEDEIRVHGTIAGSVWAPRGMLEFWADPSSVDHREEFDPTRSLIVYCATGNRSALAADTLVRIGFENVAHLDGGLKAWKDDGRPVEVL